MTFLEALKTGKPMRRGRGEWQILTNYGKFVFHAPGSPWDGESLPPLRNDYLATDWEVLCDHEQTLTTYEVGSGGPVNEHCATCGKGMVR